MDIQLSPTLNVTKINLLTDTISVTKTTTSTVLIVPLHSKGVD